MSNLVRLVLTIWAVCATFLASSCSSEIGSFDISSSRHAITLIREKPYFWSQNYLVDIVIANLPDCQRRYHLQNEALRESFSSALYLLTPSEMVLRINHHFYRFNHLTCEITIIPNAKEKDYLMKIGDFSIDTSVNKFVFHLLNQ